MGHIRSATSFRVPQFRACRKGVARELRQRQSSPECQGTKEIGPTDKVSFTTAMGGYRQGKAQEVWEVVS